ncbi:MAG: TerC family protein [Planktomarina sp.]|nr:TerC family protein [Planktomarina sp.]
MLETLATYGQIIIADLILSGDNALIIGMAAAGLTPKLRRRAILYGMVIAAILRIIFAIVATTLLGIPGILFIGSVLLFWVCWRLFVDIRENTKEKTLSKVVSAETKEINTNEVPQKSMVAALISITIADISMSLDNVLAVAAIADGDKQILIFGLALAIVLMAFAATLIMKLLTKFPWISWLGLFVLLYVAGEMFYRGFFDLSTGVGPMLGIVEGWEISKGH